MGLKLGLNLGYWGIGPQGDEASEMVAKDNGFGVTGGVPRSGAIGPGYRRATVRTHQMEEAGTGCGSLLGPRAVSSVG